MMMIRSDLSCSETRIISRYTILLGCCDRTMTYIKSNALEAPICKNALQIWDAGAPKLRIITSSYLILVVRSHKPKGALHVRSNAYAWPNMSHPMAYIAIPVHVLRRTSARIRSTPKLKFVGLSYRFAQRRLTAI